MKHFDSEYSMDYGRYEIFSTDDSGEAVLMSGSLCIYNNKTDDNDNLIAQIVFLLEKMAENNQ